jgi:2-polyprenyl-6-methoxyphenol hydroxylase-like FAD-dependent oxidoreductase
MRIAIVGAGPAGLHAAILIRQARPDARIRVVEQNAADATFGFGVVFSDQAMAFLRDDDPDTADVIDPHMKHWAEIAVVHRGERIAIDGVGFAGIGRLEFLQLLQNRAQSLGIVPEFGTRVDEVEAIGEADLVIGADGLNSAVRRSTPGAFGETVTERTNRFVWYGTNREFDALTQTFVETPHGPMTAHHYAYAPGRSTFIIEMGAGTFANSGFEGMEEPSYRAACERFFAPCLDGARLISNNSAWRRFPDLACRTWHDGNRVLLGDALHTAHFSIGSGTRLAMEDAIALVGALEAHHWSVRDALPAYQGLRQPVLTKIVAAARHSCDWYEGFDRLMELDPLPFALSYIRRAGRVDAARLRAMAPKFAATLEAHGIDLDADA